jgi:hypothetical protein
MKNMKIHNRTQLATEKINLTAEPNVAITYCTVNTVSLYKTVKFPLRTLNVPVLITAKIENET